MAAVVVSSVRTMHVSSSDEDEDIEVPSMQQLWLPRPDLPRGQRLRFNVSGRHFEAWERLFKSVPGTFFGTLDSDSVFWDYDSRSYIIDRPPMAFEAVLSFFQTGVLHCPAGMCHQQFGDELRFYNVDHRLLSQCCKQRMRHGGSSHQRSRRKRAVTASTHSSNRRARTAEELEARRHRRIRRRWQYYAILARAKLSNGGNSRPSVAEMTNAAVLSRLIDGSDSGDAEDKDLELEHFEGSSKHTTRWYLDRVWMITDLEGFPASSRHYKTSVRANTAFTVLSISLIVVSTIAFIVETIPKYRLIDVMACPVGMTTNCPFVEEERDKPPRAFFIVEAVCVSWFTLELLLRFIACPNRWLFIRSILNIIDFIAIVPFYISFILTSSASSLVVVRVVRLVRVFRIFKLSRHSSGLKVLGKTLQKSTSILATLCFFLLLGVIVFGAAVFYAEKDEPDTKFRSIPLSLWWAIVTMTTLGYGDVVPVTVAGRFVGAITAVTGVLTISLPVPIFAQNFQEEYMAEQKRRQKAERQARRPSFAESDEPDWYSAVRRGGIQREQGGTLRRATTIPTSVPYEKSGDETDPQNFPSVGRSNSVFASAQEARFRGLRSLSESGASQSEPTMSTLPILVTPQDHNLQPSTPVRVRRVRAPSPLSRQQSLDVPAAVLESNV